MKEIKMFICSWCPHCKKAKDMINELSATHPEYAEVPITMIDEELQPDIAKEYDYYYVPTFFVGEEKMHEGVPSKEAIENVFKAAYNG